MGCDAWRLKPRQQGHESCLRSLSPRWQPGKAGCAVLAGVEKVLGGEAGRFGMMPGG